MIAAPVITLGIVHIVGVLSIPEWLALAGWLGAPLIWVWGFRRLILGWRFRLLAVVLGYVWTYVVALFLMLSTL